MQFADKSLDIKFDTTFLIMVAQGKLFLAGISSYWQSRPEVIIFTALPLYTIFYVMNVSMKPCLIPLVNPWRSMSYLIGVSLCSGAVYATFTRTLCYASEYSCKELGLDDAGGTCSVQSQINFNSNLKDKNLKGVIEDCDESKKIAMAIGLIPTFLTLLFTVCAFKKHTGIRSN